MTTAIDTGVADPSPVLRGMRVGQYVLFWLLLAVGTARGAIESTWPWAVLCGAAVVGAWYALGVRWSGDRQRRQLALPWLGGLLLGWLGLVMLSVEFSWLAFALFFLCMHLLPVRPAVAVVVLLTAVVIVAQLASDTGNRPAQVLGPCLGAAVAVAMSLAYRLLVADSEQRRLLVDQLLAAQDDLVAIHDELAATQREAGALAERARLARDIHDTLAQGFSSIVLLARAGLSDAAVTADVLGQISATASDNLEEARRVVHALAPAALDDAPLPAAIRRLLDRFTEQTGVPATLTVDGDPGPLTTGVEVALLRLAQGALANVRQHAAASRVSVTLDYSTEHVSLDVVDDGRGFDPGRLESAPLGGSGFGLRAMRERLAALDGALVVESERGEGTAVAATIPLKPATS